MIVVFKDHFFKKVIFPMKKQRFLMAFGMGLAFIFLSACSVLRPVHLPNIALHQIKIEKESGADCIYQRNQTLLILPSGSAQVFQSKQMAYQVYKNQIQYFALHQWVDTPIAEWTQLFLEYQNQAQHFKSVIISPSLVETDLTIQFYVLENLQDFSETPAIARFKLLAIFTDNKKKKIMGSHIFLTQSILQKNNPESGVIAMQNAYEQMLKKVDVWIRDLTR